MEHGFVRMKKRAKGLYCWSVLCEFCSLKGGSMMFCRYMGCFVALVLVARVQWPRILEPVPRPAWGWNIEPQGLPTT